MRRFIAPALVALGLVACSDSTTAPATSPEMLQRAPEAPLYSKGASGIDGDYIVVFRSDIADPIGKADEKIARHAARARFRYDAAIKGFAATLSPAAVTMLRSDPDVAYIEQDARVSVQTTQSGATWGIDRIDQRNRPLSGTYTYTSTGSGATAYIIDTGILTSHSQFGGRAAVAYDATGGNGIDCNGHGTHVAGTVGGSTYGVAKGVSLRAVRVLDCNGSGTNSNVIAGMNWVASHHVARSVANMSLGGGYSSAVNSAATSLVNSGVFLAVASGNSGADACNYSPASAPGTITVNASDINDARATFSNYGGCTDVYAPGVNITSAWIGSTTATNTISGTSMATPHVTGVGALYKATYGDAAASTVISWITSNATANVISGNPSGTPNRLLYKATL